MLVTVWIGGNFVNGWEDSKEGGRDLLMMDVIVFCRL